jgi:hypothetical protein
LDQVDCITGSVSVKFTGLVGLRKRIVRYWQIERTANRFPTIPDIPDQQSLFESRMLFGIFQNPALVRFGEGPG